MLFSAGTFSTDGGHHFQHIAEPVCLFQQLPSRHISHSQSWSLDQQPQIIWKIVRNTHSFLLPADLLAQRDSGVGPGVCLLRSLQVILMQLPGPPARCCLPPLCCPHILTLSPSCSELPDGELCGACYFPHVLSLQAPQQVCTLISKRMYPRCFLTCIHTLFTHLGQFFHIVRVIVCLEFHS